MMKIDCFSSVLVAIDLFADEIPFLSTITNFVDLVQKVALDRIRYIYGPFKLENKYYQHLDKKDYLKTVVLLFPVLGQICFGFVRWFYSGDPDEDMFLE